MSIFPHTAPEYMPCVGFEGTILAGRAVGMRLAVGARRLVGLRRAGRVVNDSFARTGVRDVRRMFASGVRSAMRES